MTEWLALHAHDLYTWGFCVASTAAVVVFFWRVLRAVHHGRMLSRLDALRRQGFVRFRRERPAPDPDAVCFMLDYHDHVDTAKGLASRAVVDSDCTDCTPQKYIRRRHA